MSEQVELKVVYSSPIESKRPSVGIWDWIWYYVYNFVRKPGVWFAKRKLLSIAGEVTEAVSREILPVLYSNRLDCIECRDAYMALNGQPFVSNIRMILRRMQCTDHFEPFNTFLNKHRREFDESESVSAWICGFK